MGWELFLKYIPSLQICEYTLCMFGNRRCQIQKQATILSVSQMEYMFPANGSISFPRYFFPIRAHGNWVTESLLNMNIINISSKDCVAKVPVTVQSTRLDLDLWIFRIKIVLQSMMIIYCKYDEPMPKKKNADSYRYCKNCIYVQINFISQFYIFTW